MEGVVRPSHKPTNGFLQQSTRKYCKPPLHFDVHTSLMPGAPCSLTHGAWAHWASYRGLKLNADTFFALAQWDGLATPTFTGLISGPELPTEVVFGKLD